MRGDDRYHAACAKDKSLALCLLYGICGFSFHFILVFIHQRILPYSSADCALEKPLGLGARSRETGSRGQCGRGQNGEAEGVTPGAPGREMKRASRIMVHDTTIPAGRIRKNE